MPTTALAANTLPVAAKALAASLGEACAGRVDLWKYDACWEHAALLTRFREHSESLTADEDVSLDAIGGLLFDLSADSTMITVAQIGSRWDVAIVPWHDGAKRWHLTAVHPAGSTRMLQQVAELAHHTAQQQLAVEQLHGEIQACTVQIHNDFEELCFLREFSAVLRNTRIDQPIDDTAIAAVPLLRTAVRAETMVFLAPRNPSVDGARWQQIAASGCPVPADSLMQIIEESAAVESDGATVKNYADQPHAQFPHINSYVIAPVTKAQRILGLLVAVNRDPDSIDAEFGLSCEDQNAWEFGTPEAGLMSSTAAMLAGHGRNNELYREREDLLVRMVRVLVTAIEAKDTYTSGHSERVALYAKVLSEGLGLEQEYGDRVYLTGLLHDIGKIGISDATLNKPGKLTDEEFAEIKRHPDLGWSILQELHQLEYVLPGVVHHHERMDGRGYPDGLEEQTIPLIGRLLAVADAFDAMTSDRPYRSGMPVATAAAVLREGAGTQWDAEMVDKFLESLPAIEEIRNSYRRPEAAIRDQSLQEVPFEVSN